MENRIQERIQAKTRDGQLYEIFVKQFEFSPKTAEAAINVVKEIYELHRWLKAVGCAASAGSIPVALLVPSMLSALLTIFIMVEYC